MPDCWLPPGPRTRSDVIFGGLAKRSARGDDEGVQGADSEREAYRKIISRAKIVRERAAESLRRSRASRKNRGRSQKQPNTQRRFRRD